MRTPYLSILLMVFCASLCADLPYQPAFPYQGSAGIAIGGAKADNPPMSFYGSFSNDGAPAVTYDSDVKGPYFSLGASYALPLPKPFCFVSDVVVLAVRDGIYFGECSHTTRLGEPDDAELIDLFAIDGSGAGGTIAVTQEGSFSMHQTENQLDAMVALQLFRCDGIFLMPAVGYTATYRRSKMESSLVDYETGFNNGTVFEKINTWMQGARFEVGLFKGFCMNWWTLVLPSIAVYHSNNELEGTQDFGDNGSTLYTVDNHLGKNGFEASCKIYLGFDWCQWNFTGYLFGRYQSFVPGVYNPREDDDGPAHLTTKNATLWGGGLFAIYMF